MTHIGVHASVVDHVSKNNSVFGENAGNAPGGNGAGFPYICRFAQDQACWIRRDCVHTISNLCSSTVDLHSAWPPLPRRPPPASLVGIRVAPLLAERTSPLQQYQQGQQQHQQRQQHPDVCHHCIVSAERQEDEDGEHSRGTFKSTAP